MSKKESSDKKGKKVSSDKPTSINAAVKIGNNKKAHNIHPRISNKTTANLILTLEIQHFIRQDNPSRN